MWILTVELSMGKVISFLWILTPISSTISVIIVWIAMATSDWIRTQERILNSHYNGTTDYKYILKMTHSGIWEICTVTGKYGDNYLTIFSRESFRGKFKSNFDAVCSSILSRKTTALNHHNIRNPRGAAKKKSFVPTDYPPSPLLLFPFIKDAWLISASCQLERILALFRGYKNFWEFVCWLFFIFLTVAHHLNLNF